MIEKDKGNLSLTGQCVPVLPMGEYEICAQLRVTFPGTEEDSFKEAKRFSVQGKRFALAQEQIVSVYPAPGEVCSRGAILPHAAVSPCTLPFECAVLPDGERQFQTPYLALLLFHDDEMPELTQGHVGELFESAGESSVFYTKDYTQEESRCACTFMDVPGELFVRIAPAANELAYLVHGRKSDPKLKAQKLSALSEKEVQSVVFCNRIPRCGTLESPVLNHVCLVSLAGCQGIWEGAGSGRSVRLAVLYHWEFFAAEESADETLLQNVHTKGFTLPAPEHAGRIAREILQNGYVPLEHSLRDKSRTVSFYRGPFVPAATKKTVRTGDSSDALYRYDPEIGMFDLSYACAWETGKLIALAKEDIARKIMASRNTALHRMHRESVRNMLEDAGVEENVSAQLMRFFEKCYGEKTDEIMVSEGKENAGRQCE